MMSPYIPADLIFDHPARKTLEESRSCVVVRIAAVKQTWKKVDFISNFQQNIYFYVGVASVDLKKTSILILIFHFSA